MIIHIRNLRARAIVGTEDAERERQQEIVINVELEYDACRAVASDDIAKAVDYQAIADELVAEARRSRYHLLEKLADRLLAIVMSDEKILRASVRIDKPDALAAAESVSVTCSAKQRQ